MSGPIVREGDPSATRRLYWLPSFIGLLINGSPWLAGRRSFSCGLRMLDLNSLFSRLLRRVIYCNFYAIFRGIYTDESTVGDPNLLCHPAVKRAPSPAAEREDLQPA